MADIISRLKLESGEFDSKIKRASQELTAYSQHCRKMGLEMGYANKDAKEFAKSLGSMQTTATTARGKVSELSDAFVNLKAMYNQMTDAEKRGEFGKNLAASLDQLKQRTQQAKQELADITKELSGASNIGGGGGLFSSDKLSGMLQVFGGNLMTKGVELATGAITGLINETGEMIRQGVELAKQGEGIRIAFQRLGRGDILQGLREATHGTVTDLELMKAAVKFNDFKLPVEELGTMLAFAQQKAKDTGQSVDYMVDSIVTGLGRKSLMILDNLGLSATEIRERMKETGDMTKAVGDIIREQMAKAGDYVETAADRAAQANVSLQNKMEELGRKFAPVEEASNQLWTSMKIGILDVIGGPLARLLNQLTEAGRLKNALSDINGDGSGGKETRTDKALRILREYSGGGKGIEGKRELYNRQVAKFQEQEERAWRKVNEARKKYDEELKKSQKRNSASGVAGGTANMALTGYENAIKKAEAEAKAFQIARATYEKGGQDILNPKPVVTGTGGTTDTKKTGKVNTDEFTEIIGLIGNAQERVSDLQKRISESWDNNEIARLRKELKEAQNELDVLQGKLPKDTVAEITIKADTTDALRKLENIDGVSIDPKTFSITATDEALPLLRNIQGVSIDPKTMTVTADTTDALLKVQEMVSDLNGTIVSISVVPQVTDEDIERSLREQYGKPIEVPVVPKTTGEAIEQEIRVKLAEQNMDADMQTLRTLMETKIQNGLEGINIPSDSLFQKIMGEGMDIPDEYWEELQDKINKKLKDLGIDALNIDFKTGNVKGRSKDTQNVSGTEQFKKTMGDISQLTGGVTSIVSGIQQLGVEIPEGMSKVLGSINVISGILTTIASLATIMTATSTAKSVPLIGWLLAGGGIVHAADGYSVPGNHYSGDNVPALLNSGELVLNRAQQFNLASQLEGNGMQGLNLTATIRGEQIRLALNNNGRRTGRGEYVQSNRR